MDKKEQTQIQQKEIEMIDAQDMLSLFDESRFSDLFRAIVERFIPETDKMFNYKLLLRNELTSSGNFEIPPIDIDNRFLSKTIGMLLITELIKGNFKFVEKMTNGVESFINIDRFKLGTDSIINAYLFDIALYLGNGYVITVFDISPEHWFYSISQENLFKMIQFCFDTVNFSFLSPKLLYYRKTPGGTDSFESTVISFYAPIGISTLSYFRYLVLNFGVCPASMFRKSVKRKLRSSITTSNTSKKLNKEKRKV